MAAGLAGRTTTAIALALALLAGCSDERPASDTLPSGSAEPSTSTEALPPLGPPDFPVPAAARTEDDAGAEAFLRYWLELLHHQQGILDGQPLRDLGPECQECLRIARNYDEAAAAGNRYVGGEITLDSVAEPTVIGDEMVLSFLAYGEPVSLVDASGAVLEANPDRARLSSGISLLWSDERRGWLVTGFNLG